MAGATLRNSLLTCRLQGMLVENEQVGLLSALLGAGIFVHDLCLPRHNIKQNTQCAPKAWSASGAYHPRARLCRREGLRLAASNLPWVDVLPQEGANVYSILQRDQLVLSRAALEALVARLQRPIKR